jgi:predicted ArsR family transcriptional regulator
MTRSAERHGNNLPDTPDTLTIWDGMRVRDRILAFIEEHQRVRRADIVAAMDVNMNSLRWCLGMLQRDGCIEVVDIAPSSCNTPCHVYGPVP